MDRMLATSFTNISTANADILPTLVHEVKGGGYVTMGYCTVYVVHCTLHSVQCTLYTIHCTLYTRSKVVVMSSRGIVYRCI